jgi:hypothetical protein
VSEIGDGSSRSGRDDGQSASVRMRKGEEQGFGEVVRRGENNEAEQAGNKGDAVASKLTEPLELGSYPSACVGSDRRA